MAPSARQTQAIFALTIVAFVSALLFGGGAYRGLPSDYIPQFLSLPVLALVAAPACSVLRRDRLLLGVVVALVVLPVLHLVPMPPALWGRLPGREAILAAYATADIAAPWLPISLSPPETWRASFSLLPGLAVFLGALRLDARRRRALVWIAIAYGLISIPLGLMQIAGGGESPLYFFEITNPGNAVGFFANKNHYGALFFALIPLAAGLALSRRSGPFRAADVGLAGALSAAFVIGLALSESRSALVLGLVSIGMTIVLLGREELGVLLRRRAALVAIAAGLAGMVVIALAMGMGTIIERLGSEGLADRHRSTFFVVTWDAAGAYFPFGSGLGTFERIYQFHEPPWAVFDHLVNHAHNDYLEILLEAGAPGLALTIAFLVWAGRAALAWSSERSQEARLALGAGVAILVLSLHSAWDYPLRSIALSVVFALACALMVRAPVLPETAPEKPSRFAEMFAFARARIHKRPRRTRAGVRRRHTCGHTVTFVIQAVAYPEKHADT